MKSHLEKKNNIPQYIVGSSNIDAVDDFLINCETMFTSLKKKLIKA